MKFSIIIPLYNVEQYIEKCIESIANQSFYDYEAIFIDDGCTDNSAIIAEELATNKGIPFKIIHQTNQGLSAARNAGLKEASGEYVLFLDSDDWIEPNALSTLAENINGEDLICFSGRRYFENSGIYEEADLLERKKYGTGGDYYSENALKHRYFAFVCVVLRAYRRQYLVENKLCFEPGIKHEDNLFTPLACFYAKKVKVIPDALYNYRIRRSSIMTSRGLQNRKDIIHIANTLAEFFSKQQAIDKTTLYQALTHHYQSSFSNCTGAVDKEILPIVDWKAYKTVSRTKLRHRIQYCAMRISPRLFRLVNKI